MVGNANNTTYCYGVESRTKHFKHVNLAKRSKVQYMTSKVHTRSNTTLTTPYICSRCHLQQIEPFIDLHITGGRYWATVPYLTEPNFVMDIRFFCGWRAQGIILLQGRYSVSRERTDQSNLVRSTREWPLITHGNNLDNTWKGGMNRDERRHTWWSLSARCDYSEYTPY